MTSWYSDVNFSSNLTIYSFIHLEFHDSPSDHRYDHRRFRKDAENVAGSASKQNIFCSHCVILSNSKWEMKIIHKPILFPLEAHLIAKAQQKGHSPHAMNIHLTMSDLQPPDRRCTSLCRSWKNTRVDSHHFELNLPILISPNLTTRRKDRLLRREEGNSLIPMHCRVIKRSNTPNNDPKGDHSTVLLDLRGESPDTTSEIDVPPPNKEAKQDKMCFQIAAKKEQRNKNMILRLHIRYAKRADRI